MLLSFFTLTAISKEWLVMTHGTGEVMFMIGAIWILNRYVGKMVSDLLQKQREVRNESPVNVIALETV